MCVYVWLSFKSQPREARLTPQRRPTPAQDKSADHTKPVKSQPHQYLGTSLQSLYPPKTHHFPRVMQSLLPWKHRESWRRQGGGTSNRGGKGVGARGNAGMRYGKRVDKKSSDGDE
jgi:hypothetical protein